MPKVRAYGADATLKACREAGYGVAPLAGYRSLDFKSTDLSSAQPLGDDRCSGAGATPRIPIAVSSPTRDRSRSRSTCVAPVSG